MAALPRSCGPGLGGGVDDAWGAWLDASLGHLRRAQLLRTLRPTVWCGSSSQALIHRADLDAWVAGADPVVRHYDDCCGPLYGSAVLTTAAAVTAAGGAAGSIPQPSHAQRSLQPPPLQQQQSQQQEEEALVPLRLFSLNDYLGLASHPEVAAAAARTASTAGLGPRSSALVGGYTHSHRQLEEALARLKGAEDCLLFPTGFAANLAALTCLAAAAPAGTGPSGGDTPTATSSSSSAAGAGHGGGGGGGGGGGVAIFSDELNHASIIDGARLALRSGGGGGGGDGDAVRLHVYRHNDLAHLESLLASTPPGVRRLVVTDSLFSMDGDFADLRGIVALKRRHPFLLAVDEAHATLVCGEGGGGAAEALGVASEVDVHVGTLSKAFGSLGGFAACSAQLKQLLLNRGRPYVYSTALPLPVVEAAAAALRVSNRESWRRRHVWSLVARLGAGLGVPALSPVVPLVVGGEGPTLQLAADLLRAGMHVPPIRPPTVPAGTCRLRVSLSAAHSHADVDDLVRLVRQSGVALQRLPHLEVAAAGLPGGAGGGGGGSAGLLAGELAAARAAADAEAVAGGVVVAGVGPRRSKL